MHEALQRKISNQRLRLRDARGSYKATQQRSSSACELQRLQDKISELEAEKMVTAELVSGKLQGAQMQNEELTRELAETERTARLAMQENRRLADIVRQVKKDNSELRLVAELRRKISVVAESDRLKTTHQRTTMRIEAAPTSFPDFASYASSHLYSTQYRQLQHGPSIQCFGETEYLHSTPSIRCFGDEPSFGPLTGIRGLKPTASLSEVNDLRPTASLEVMDGGWLGKREVSFP